MMKLYALSLIVGFLMVSVGSFFDLWFLFLGLVLVIISTAVMLVWHAKHARWTCPECGSDFSISAKQNTLSINSGINRKKLTCPKCGHNGYMSGTIIK